MRSKWINRRLAALHGRLTCHRQMLATPGYSYATRTMEAVARTHEKIRRLKADPSYRPLLPMDLPEVHAAKRFDFKPLKD